MNGKSSGNVAQSKSQSKSKSKESQQATRTSGTTNADSEHQNVEEVEQAEEEAADSNSTADDVAGSESGADMDKPAEVTVAAGNVGAGRSDEDGASNPDEDSSGSGGQREAGAGSGGIGRGSASAGIKAVRRAHLTLSRIEPWSVMKFSFIVSLVCFIVLFVAVAVIYMILSALGVFDAVTDLITSLVEGGEAEEDAIGMNPETWFVPARVLGYTGLIGALNIILITALATVGAMIYNLAADLVGGLDITLSEIE